MTQFHATMVDETGCEFGVLIAAPSMLEATDKLREDYPESRVKAICTSEQLMQEQLEREERARRAYENGEQW